MDSRRQAVKRMLGIIGLSFAIPPAGWVWLARTPWRWWTKTLMAVPVLALAVAHLMAFWGMRFELLGSGTIHPYFPKGESHYAALESKAQADGMPAPAQPPPAPAPLPEPQVRPATAQAVPPEKPAPLAGLWPGFNGPNRDAQYREAPILTTWPAKGLPELWRRPVGGGYASVVIAAGRIFTIEQRRAKEVAVAYDLDSGRELWTSAWDALFQESMGGDGPRATPAWDQGTLYVLGAEGELRAIDALSGKTVLPGGAGGKSVVAYDKTSGARLWSALDDRASYTAPMLVTLAGRRQVLAVTATRAAGLDPDSGELLWEFPWKTEYDINSALPVIVSPDRFVLSAGYDHGAALVEISQSGGKLSAAAIWNSKALKNRFNSNALHNGIIYGMDEGILAAIDAATGERKWKGGRYGYGQFVMAEGYLVILSESGELALVKANPGRHEELARFQAIEGKTWNPPAIAAGRLVVRNTTEMACYRIGL